MYVVDTSVVIKWYVEEEDSDKAEVILDDYKEGKLQLVEPDILVYEFVNVMRYNRSFSSGERMECIRNLYDLEIYLISPYQSLIEKANKTAENTNISIYDSVFISVAQELGCEFITADEELYNKVKSLEFVKLLKNI